MPYIITSALAMYPSKISGHAKPAGTVPLLTWLYQQRAQSTTSEEYDHYQHCIFEVDAFNINYNINFALR